MAAPTEAQIAHQNLIEKLDIHSIHKNFRNPNWKPNSRRNKNLKTIVGDASKREASAIASQDVSGNATPAAEDGLSTSGASTPAAGSNGNLPPNLAQASRSLTKLVLEKSLRQAGGASATATATTSASASGGASAGGGAGGAGGAGTGAVSAPNATYTNIESAPSLAHAKRYCDVTGLPAPYLDPKTRMRYHNREVFGLIRSLPQSSAELYLEARGAHTVLK